MFGDNVLSLLFRVTELSNQSLGLTTSRIWVCSLRQLHFNLRLMGFGYVFEIFLFSSEQLVESKVFPLIIAVSGNVGSETPIKCEHSDILGVFLKKTVCYEIGLLCLEIEKFYIIFSFVSLILGM